MIPLHQLRDHTLPKTCGSYSTAENRDYLPIAHKIRKLTELLEITIIFVLHFSFFPYPVGLLFVKPYLQFARCSVRSAFGFYIF